MSENEPIANPAPVDSESSGQRSLEPESREPVSLQLQPPEEPPSRVPMMIGAAVVLTVVVIAIAISLAHKDDSTDQKGLAAPDPYAASLEISDLKMSTAENFAGGSVTYLEGKIANNGQRTLTSVTVQVGFYNELKELVQKESMPLLVITAREPYVDTGPLSASPLKPGDTREFRLTFEHVSADWNRNYPEVRAVHVAG